MADEHRNQHDDALPEPTVADVLAEAGEGAAPGHPAVGAPATSTGETSSRGTDVVDPPA